MSEDNTKDVVDFAAQKMPYKMAPELQLEFGFEEAQALHAVLHKGAQKGIYEISEYQAIYILNDKIESYLKSRSR